MSPGRSTRRVRAARFPRKPSWSATCWRGLRTKQRRGLAGVLNGTGILLHTNLAPAPLAREALDAVADAAGGASNLEFDLNAGARGSRYDRLGALLHAATGAEDALVVNNCAAAVLLVPRHVRARAGRRAARGPRCAQPAHRDRRRFPAARRAGPQRRDADRSRRDEQSPHRRLRACAFAAHRAAAARASRPITASTGSSKT